MRRPASGPHRCLGDRHGEGVWMMERWNESETREGGSLVFPGEGLMIVIAVLHLHRGRLPRNHKISNPYQKFHNLSVNPMQFATNPGRWATLTL